LPLKFTGFIVRINKKYMFATGVLLAATIALHNLLDPPDWVELHLTNVPLGLIDVYVIAASREGDVPLKWYFAKVIPFVGDARRLGQEWSRPVSGDQRKGDVQWITADHYGILGRRKSGEWIVWWLKPEDVEKPTPLRYLIGGGVRVTIRASGIEEATLAPKSLTAQVKND
jgi:hypothetical protein